MAVFCPAAGSKVPAEIDSEIIIDYRLIKEVLTMKTIIHNGKTHRAAFFTAGSAGLRSAVRILFCLMLTVALVLPAAIPDASYAASKKSKYTTAKTHYVDGNTLVFKGKVINNQYTKYAPGNVTATGKSKSIKIKWGKAKKKKISGYIILRKDQNSNTWRQIAKVSKSKKSYKDKKARDANTLYSYTVVSYRKIGKKTMVSLPRYFASAVTTRSDLNNVYSVKVTNLANVTSIMAGSCAQVSLKYPNDAYTTAITWASSNSAIASVDANGLVYGNSPGVATIYAKSHTGNIVSFDTHITRGGTAQAMIDTFSAWMGYSRINGYQNGIIDIYNSIMPWPAGYKMKYSDAWCDATVTAAAIKTGNAERIGRECSVPRHVKIFQQMGIWIEDGTITPVPGDIIVYSWNKFTQPNNASPSHIGIVAKVENGKITAIEGNRGIGVVATRDIPVGWGCIRGYARPHYAN